MANHRPYVRGFTHVFHYVRCFIFSNSKNSKYTRTTGTRCLPTPWDRPAHRSRKSMTRLWWRWPTSQGHMGAGGGPARAGGWRFGEVGSCHHLAPRYAPGDRCGGDGFTRHGDGGLHDGAPFFCPKQGQRPKKGHVESLENQFPDLLCDGSWSMNRPPRLRMSTRARSK